MSTASTLHTQENRVEKIISTAVDSPSIQNKYYYSFTGEILNPPSQSIIISGLLCLHRASRRKEVGCVLVQSSPHLHCPLRNFFNTSTGKHIKSITSGRTVTSYKAHNRAPISTCYFSFAEKVPKFSAARTSSSLPAQHGAQLRAQKWTKLHPYRDPQQQADNKFTLSRKR